MKALDDWQIEDIRRQKAEGKTAFQLAQQYHVHYKTIEGYCKPDRVIDGNNTSDGSECMNIKVWFNNGKSLNFEKVDMYKKVLELGVYQIWRAGEVVGILEAANVSALIPI